MFSELKVTLRNQVKKEENEQAIKEQSLKINLLIEI